MSKKLGRNEPCWCGSGKKYKKCHLHRDQREPIKPWEIDKELRKAFSYGTCSSPDSFHDDCSRKIIRAHTVPKSASLKAIAKDGHIYGCVASMASLQKNDGTLTPELIGINKASTFTGFCSVHDNKIFSPLENEPFQKTQQQCFLLAYRAFAREVYTKKASAKLAELRTNLDQGRPAEDQVRLQMEMSTMNSGTELALKDNAFHKQQFDVLLEANRYDDCCALVFSFDEPPPVMASGASNPDYDFNGKQLQDLDDYSIHPDLITMSSFYDGRRGYIVFSWLKYCSKTNEQLLSSLIQKPRKLLTMYFLQYMFASMENCFISPPWWESLNDHQQNKIIDLMMVDTHPTYGTISDVISSVLLNVPFPEIKDIKIINWTY